MADPIQTPVTGRKDPIDPREPVGALAEFHRALNTGDLALMTRNWDASDAASMDNPLRRPCADYASATFSSRFFMSSACSSSVLRMSSMSLRVVGSSVPSQRAISE